MNSTPKYRLWHYVNKFEIGTGKIAYALCNHNSSIEPTMMGSNWIKLVTCEKCKKIYNENISYNNS